MSKNETIKVFRLCFNVMFLAAVKMQNGLSPISWRITNQSYLMNGTTTINTVKNRKTICIFYCYIIFVLYHLSATSSKVTKAKVSLFGFIQKKFLPLKVLA
jgi:hypothetical protein